MNPCLPISYWCLPWVEAAWKPEAGATDARLRSASLLPERGSRWWGLALEARGSCPAHTSLTWQVTKMQSTLEGTVLSSLLAPATIKTTTIWIVEK